MPDAKPRLYWQRRAFAMWRDLELPDEDRHEFASEMFKRDVRSWSQLSVAELGVVVHVLRGVHLIEELRRQRGLVSRPYGGGVADRSVRDAEQPPAPGVASFDPGSPGEATVAPGAGRSHQVRNVWGGR